MVKCRVDTQIGLLLIQVRKCEFCRCRNNLSITRYQHFSCKCQKSKPTHRENKTYRGNLWRLATRSYLTETKYASLYYAELAERFIWHRSSNLVRDWLSKGPSQAQHSTPANIDCCKHSLYTYIHTYIYLNQATWPIQNTHTKKDRQRRQTDIQNRSFGMTHWNVLWADSLSHST